MPECPKVHFVALRFKLISIDFMGHLRAQKETDLVQNGEESFVSYVTVLLFFFCLFFLSMLI